MAAPRVNTRYKLVDTHRSLKKGLSDLEESELLSVDCEGVCLGRYGKLCLIQVATSEMIYLFDVVKLGRAVFDRGLKEILEDPSITKLFYDCKEDCNALLHQFDVRVEGIEDVQVLNQILKKLSGKQIRFVHGLRKAMEYHLPDCQFEEDVKEEVSDAMEENSQLWRKRPLSEMLQQYAANDVSHLKLLYGEILESATHLQYSERFVRELLQYSSERYANFARDNPLYEEGSRYFRTARLPERIIPKKINADSFIPFSKVGVRCSKCYQDTTNTRRRQCHRCLAIDRED